MPVLPILRWPDPRLSMICDAVAPGEDVSQLAADMLETMYAAPGRGLATPQVGVLKRLFVMDVAWKTGTPAARVCINPVITLRSDEMAEGPEGCLSIPGLVAPVNRSQRVTFRWTDAEGILREAMLDGFAAICVQHEMDHLDGIVTFDRMTPDARAAALAGYAA